MTKFRANPNNKALVTILFALVACATSIYIFRSAFLFDFENDWFSDNKKLELFPDVLLWRTSGRDVALTDQEGWGLVSGNVVGFQRSNRYRWFFAVEIGPGKTNIVCLSAIKDGATSLNNMTNTTLGSFSDIGNLL